MTVKDLLKIAKTRGLTNYSKLRKVELIALLKKSPVKSPVKHKSPKRKSPKRKSPKNDFSPKLVGKKAPRKMSHSITDKWLEEVAKKYFPPEDLPTWVKQDEFYKESMHDLLTIVVDEVFLHPKWRKSAVACLSQWLVQLCPGFLDIGDLDVLEGKVEDEYLYLKIPKEVFDEIKNTMVKTET